MCTVQDDGALAIPGVGRVQVAELAALEDGKRQRCFTLWLEKHSAIGFALDITEVNAPGACRVGALWRQPFCDCVSAEPLMTLEASLWRPLAVVACRGRRFGVRCASNRDGQIRYQIPASQFVCQPRLATEVARILCR